MRYQDIMEAVGTANIFRAARAALHTRLNEYLLRQWDEFPDTGRDVHDKYDAFYQAKQADRERFVKVTLNYASEALRHVAREGLQARFGNKVEIDGRVIYPSDVSVFVSAREYSNDEYKHSGGYFMSATSRIRVFVESDRVFYAAMSMIQLAIMGDAEDADALVDVITPVFVHEYVHFVQHLAGGHNEKASDYGYTTVGGGKRGNRRYPRKDTVHYLRYKGSAGEIESFAAEAASEIIQDLERHRRYGVTDYDIEAALQDVAQGYGGNRTVDHYRELVYNALEGYYAETGLNPAEMQTVYKRFLKLLYQSLNGYLKTKMGKRRTTVDFKRYPNTWIEAAKQGLPRAAAVIAMEIAPQILHGYEWQDTARLIQYAEPISEASHFLQKMFFNDEWDAGQAEKIDRVMKTLVGRQIDALRAAQRDAA